MSDEVQTPAESSPEKPPRNPMERMLVWGGIAIMLVIVATEGTARMGYTMSLNKISERLELDDMGDESQPLTVEEAETLLIGFPAKTEADGKVSFRWKGLIKDFGAIHLRVGDENHVLGYETDAPPEEELFVPSGEANGEDGGGEMAGAEMSGGPGPGSGEGGGGEGRGGRRFDPMQADTDGDGKISREEAPERMQEVFDEIDSNGDGFLDEAEFEARRAARRERGQTEGRPDSGEEAAPSEPSDSPKGEESSESTEAEKSDTEEADSTESPTESTTQIPESAVDRMKVVVDVNFNRTPLQEALKYLCDEAQLKLAIDGDALKNSGYTKNMTQNLDLGKVPMEQALAKIVTSYDQMVVSLDGDSKTLHVLTKPFAEKKGMTIYEFN